MSKISELSSKGSDLTECALTIAKKNQLILQDLRRNLTRTSCKSLQESFTTSTKTAYKILVKILPRSYKI